MSDFAESRLFRFEIENKEKWREWGQKIPFLVFPESWAVCICPPVLGAMIRFRVRASSKPEMDSVSVYLDCHNNLGFFSDSEGNRVPYWEVYPVEGDTARFELNDTEGLFKAIQQSLDESIDLS